MQIIRSSIHLPNSGSRDAGASTVPRAAESMAVRSPDRVAVGTQGDDPEPAIQRYPALVRMGAEDLRVQRALAVYDDVQHLARRDRIRSLMGIDDYA